MADADQTLNIETRGSTIFLTTFFFFSFHFPLNYLYVLNSIMSGLWMMAYNSGLRSDSAKESSKYWQRFHAKKEDGHH